MTSICGSAVCAREKVTHSANMQIDALLDVRIVLIGRRIANSTCMTCVPRSMDAGCKQAPVSEAVFSQLSDGERRRAGVERKINVVRKLRRPDVNHPRVGKIDGDRKHGDRGER